MNRKIVVFHYDTPIPHASLAIGKNREKLDTESQCVRRIARISFDESSVLAFAKAFGLLSVKACENYLSQFYLD